MHIDLRTLRPDQAYFTMIQSLVPRPIAWVLSENADGSLNLAPFSFFNAICSNPPMVALSVGRKPTGEAKDTWANIAAREEFVVMIPHREQLEAVNASSATLPAGVSEVERLGLVTVPFEGSRLPRLVDSRVAFACKRHQILEIGNGPQGLIIALVGSLYLDDAILETDPKGRLKVRADRLDPIGRLGAVEYAFLGEITRLARPE